MFRLMIDGRIVDVADWAAIYTLEERGKVCGGTLMRTTNNPRWFHILELDPRRARPDSKQPEQRTAHTPTKPARDNSGRVVWGFFICLGFIGCVAGIMNPDHGRSNRESTNDRERARTKRMVEGWFSGDSRESKYETERERDRQKAYGMFRDEGFSPEQADEASALAQEMAERDAKIRAGIYRKP